MVRASMRCLDLALIIVLAASACDKPADAPPTTAPASEPVAGNPDGESPDPGDPVPSDGVDPSPTDNDGAGLGPAAETMADDPVEVPDDPAEGLSTPTSFATVKIEVRTPDGKIARPGAQIIRWEELTRIPVDFQGKLHEFIVSVQRSGKKASLQLSYVLDGTDVLRDYATDTKLGKRELLRIDDGTALALTIGSKTIKPKPPSKKKIDTPEGNDPLTGVDGTSKK